MTKRFHEFCKVQECANRRTTVSGENSIRALVFGFVSLIFEMYLLSKIKRLIKKKVLEHLDLSEKVVILYIYAGISLIQRFHGMYKFKNMLFVKLPFPASNK